MSRLKSMAVAFVLIAPGLAGCGAGSKVVTGVAFTDEVVAGDWIAGIDATLALGGVSLPSAKFPLYNPKNPSQVLGGIETRGDHVLVEVNATEALNLPDLADGSRLPNGDSIPLQFPSGLTPIGIPAFNSNSRVYVAIHGKQIMIGVAISILKEDSLKIPLSLFLPFSIAGSTPISGMGGFYLGEKQGVAVFALKDSSQAAANPAFARATSSASTSRIEIRDEAITRSKLKKFQRARDRMRGVRLD